MKTLTALAVMLAFAFTLPTIAPAAHKTSSAQDAVTKAKTTLRGWVVDNRQVAWRWQDKAGLDRSETRRLERRGSVPYLRTLVHMWWKRAHHAMKSYREAQLAAPAVGVGIWDTLANCESTNNWSYNGPSGFDGGLQFLPKTWTDHGGGQFAPYAYQATREQQIAIAVRVLASSGWGAWPYCSRMLGLL